MNKDLKQSIKYRENSIISKSILRTNKLDITLFCMAAGTEISEHTSTKKGFVYILEGEGVFYLEKEKIEMKPQIIIFLEENNLHSLKAKKDTSFILVLT